MIVCFTDAYMYHYIPLFMCMDVKRGTESCNRPHKQTFKNNSKIKKINGELENFDFFKGIDTRHHTKFFL